MTAQFKEVRFSTMQEFQQWLDFHAKYKVDFEDRGQDLQQMSIHESGEILHCDFNANIYNGKFVELPIVQGEAIKVFDRESGFFIPYYGLVVESVK